MNVMYSAVGAAGFWGFVLVKVWGTAFALWSWWWLLLPLVPWLGLGLRHLGLLP